MKTNYYINDLPDNFNIEGDIAIDTEAMGLNHYRDRLCVVQISDAKKNAYVVHFSQPVYECPNLKKLLIKEDSTKIFHYGRFDIAIIQYYLAIDIKNVYCTKIASRLSRTYTDQHSLKELCYELLGVRISKQQQSSDWGAQTLTKAQVEYAASDVLHLHDLRKILNQMLARENRMDIAQKCFDFLPTRATLDIIGWPELDIFAHSM